jgi:hypothetical protein
VAVHPATDVLVPASVNAKLTWPDGTTEPMSDPGDIGDCATVAVKVTELFTTDVAEGPIVIVEDP